MRPVKVRTNVAFVNNKPGWISCLTFDEVESKDEEIYKLQNELVEVRSSFNVESSEFRMQIKVVKIVRFLSFTETLKLGLLDFSLL